jgi:hypothetical protein
MTVAEVCARNRASTGAGAAAQLPLLLPPPREY